ncbi:uncharacterized protein LOC125500192 [Athalia rosae]|uniref:uncharacterized protein LOC125500192 n=1 Tax=Athalia rosae TaxID=37344 RepID=UPI0020333346|nr:uncharacterized protein LOC125500192 [Athalia rosae]
MTKANPRADTEAFTEISVMFPFKTKEDILIFEGNLATDPELMDKLVKYLSQIGGNSAKENIFRIMRKVFTNDVARQSSWLGLRNNFKISCLKTTLGIKIAVMTRFKMTDKEFEEIASEWLRQANQRCTREQKRVQKNL